MKKKHISAPRPFRLYQSQREVVERYVQSMRLGEEGFKIATESFADFEAMVTSLPVGKDLAPSDVMSIAVDVALNYGAAGAPNRDEKVVDPDRQAVEYIVDFLESLPRAYRIRFELPEVPAWGDFSIRLADNIALIGQLPTGTAPPQNRLVSLLRGNDAPPVDGGVYLEFQLHGFASSSLDSPVVAESMALLKQSLFLLQHFGVFSTLVWGQRQGTALIYDEVSGEAKSLSLPDNLATVLGGLRPDVDGLNVWEQGKTLLGGITRPPASNVEWIQAVEVSARQIPIFFSNRHRTGFPRIAAAIEWYEDSHLIGDQSLAFLSACIGLESIFGEDEGLGELSKRLGDRYSFMLGSDRDDRARLGREFEEILAVRGKLVHARENRLKAKDLQHLDKVRGMLWQSIRHELRPFVATPSRRGSGSP